MEKNMLRELNIDEMMMVSGGQASGNEENEDAENDMAEIMDEIIVTGRRGSGRNRTVTITFTSAIQVAAAIPNIPFNLDRGLGGSDVFATIPEGASITGRDRDGNDIPDVVDNAIADGVLLLAPQATRNSEGNLEIPDPSGGF